MNREAVAEADEKFFFDQNIFDEDHIDPALLEEEEPPPPSFSEEELAAAKQAAFQDGHDQATQKEKQSRSQQLAIVMETMSRDMASLFQAESAREKLYEREVVQLTLSTFEKLFPFYSEKAGFDEMRAAMEQVIQAHQGQKTILVRVNPELSEGVTATLKVLQEKNPDVRFTVQGDETVQGTNCKLSWEDGGALHDTAEMAENILNILKDGLAGEGANRHDNESASADAVEAPQAASEPSSSDEEPDDPALKEKSDE